MRGSDTRSALFCLQTSIHQDKEKRLFSLSVQEEEELEKKVPLAPKRNINLDIISVQKHVQLPWHKKVWSEFHLIDCQDFGWVRTFLAAVLTLATPHGKERNF